MAGLGAAAGYEFYHRLWTAKSLELLQKPLRKSLGFDQAVAQKLFDERALAPTFPLAKAVDLRINGNYGLKQDLLMDSYRLQVVGVDQASKFSQYVPDVTAWSYKYAAEQAAYTGHDTKEAPKAPAGSAGEMMPSTPPPAAGGFDVNALFAKAFANADAAQGGRPQHGQEEAGLSDSTLDPGTPGLLLKIDEVTKLGRKEWVTQFKCIEGWSEIVHWAGVPLRDFIAAYPPAKNAKGALPRYVYMETPNGDYYCGFELRECLHPQSLLTTEMSGKPLTQAHGAPFRLHMPIKYGYKQIKRIGLIAYTDDKPDDYWTRLGYDWYAGL